jgi:hypothetical protein
MSLYNLLFGVSNQAPLVLNLLGKTEGDFGRFRDAYITEQYLVVHTRCGGGNRESYEHVFDEMASHPLYVHDQDDDFDCTYCDFFFKHPPGVAEQMAAIASDNPQMAPAEKWQKLFAHLGKK